MTSRTDFDRTIDAFFKGGSDGLDGPVPWSLTAKAEAYLDEPGQEASPSEPEAGA